MHSRERIGTEIFLLLQCLLPVRHFTCLPGNHSLYSTTVSKNIMVSASTKKGCYISILNIIQGDVEATQVCPGLLYIEDDISMWCPDILVGAQGPSTYSGEETRELYSMGPSIDTSMCCLSPPPILFPIIIGKILFLWLCESGCPEPQKSIRRNVTQGTYMTWPCHHMNTTHGVLITIFAVWHLSLLFAFPVFLWNSTACLINIL